jgi:ankyrin repeat protein
MLRERPELRGELKPEHHLMMQAPAERGDARVLETMLSCGFDPNVGDKDNVTSLHRAAMAGCVEAVRVLLAHGASLTAVDGMFAAVRWCGRRRDGVIRRRGRTRWVWRIC